MAKRSLLSRCPSYVGYGIASNGLTNVSVRVSLHLRFLNNIKISPKYFVITLILYERFLWWYSRTFGELWYAVWHCEILRALYTLSQTERFYCVTSYLTEKLSKLGSFDRQWRRTQNCPFQPSFTQRTTQFTQGIPQFPQFTFFIYHSHTHKKTHRTDKKKLKNLMENLCCAREHSIQFFVQFFYTFKLHSLT